MSTTETMTSVDPFVKLRQALSIDVPLLGNMADQEAKTKVWEKHTERYVAFLRTATPDAIARLLLMYDESLKKRSGPSIEQITQKIELCKRRAFQFADAQSKNSTPCFLAEKWEAFSQSLEGLVHLLSNSEAA